MWIVTIAIVVTLLVVFTLSGGFMHGDLVE
jgi:hypothetical protein